MGSKHVSGIDIRDLALVRSHGNTLERVSIMICLIPRTCLLSCAQDAPQGDHSHDTAAVHSSLHLKEVAAELKEGVTAG
jgi:hypothetical protein